MRKVKQIRAPKYDHARLMDVHGDYTAEDMGRAVADHTATEAAAGGDEGMEEAAAE